MGRRATLGKVIAAYSAAALVVVAMVSGCATYQQSKKAAVGGGITTGVGLVIAIVGVSIALATVSNGAASFSCGTSSVCPVASDLGIVGVFVVPIGTVIAAGGLLGMAAYEKPGDPSRLRVSVPPPPPPQADDPFWCQRDSGICTNHQDSCGPDCLGAKSVWCAPYTTVDGEPGLLCGLSEDVCFVLTSSEHNRRGRENVGECAQRSEPFP
jgi:hypothetical protein